MTAPEGVLAAWERESPGGVNWQDAADLHITMAFLGPWQETHVPTIKKMLPSLPAAPDTVTAGNWLLLPRPEKFSAVAIGVVNGAGALKEIMSEWHEPLRRLVGGPPSRGEFMPHITLGRPDRKAGNQDMDGWREWVEKRAPQPVEWKVEAPAVYTWADDRTVRRFRRV